MKTCLIVDDEEFSAEMLATMLRKSFDCTIVTSGKEAWSIIEPKWLKGESFDLICCDLTMPELSGHGLIRKIRSLETSRAESCASPSKIFVVSAGTFPWGMGETLLDGVADGYISKPCHRDKLLEMMVQHGVLEPGEI
ncbi:response regulator [Geomonas paludis]|uniref:Response regulator n=1 Tax=Geomonas paludis TaxID=2740185 RepID=A0A6V8MY46_9BACT|nr:response regulator [Geomonas paludis]UPU34667.1 response regulator [Geomonas paludis]GFO65041.1 hypothetical protein GMPD_29600 [Geomonas paludis]